MNRCPYCGAGGDQACRSTCDGGYTPPAESFLSREEYVDAANEAGWLIEVYDPDDEALDEAWAVKGSYSFGPWISRENVPPGAVYQWRTKGQEPRDKLWLNSQPEDMTADDGVFPSEFRVATLHRAPAATPADALSDGGGE